MKLLKLLKTLAVVAIAFGGLTIFSGGRALFGGAEAQAAVGDAVGFVLWFNFLAGFAYVLTGIGLLRRWVWSAMASAALALATAIATVAFAAHVMTGGHYEMRTVGALALRLGFWVLVAVVAKRCTSR
jgi:hypothetical protein